MLSLPGGGLSTLGRLELIARSGATGIFTTPTYALRMAEIAAEEGIDLRGNTVRTIIVAGEPGGSLPAVRSRIETAWNGAVIDDATLQRDLAIEAQRAKQPEIHIEPHRLAKYGVVAHVMASAQREGLTKLGVIGGT